MPLTPPVRDQNRVFLKIVPLLELSVRTRRDFTLPSPSISAPAAIFLRRICRQSTDPPPSSLHYCLFAEGPEMLREIWKLFDFFYIPRPPRPYIHLFVAMGLIRNENPKCFRRRMPHLLHTRRKPIPSGTSLATYAVFNLGIVHLLMTHQYKGGNGMAHYPLAYRSPTDLQAIRRIHKTQQKIFSAFDAGVTAPVAGQLYNSCEWMRTVLP
ncbi:MAG: hypothetical protein GC164_14085 [Phycisphaera sp.]|nr:hypothetical protein [Phycisphaera sp.]